VIRWLLFFAVGIGLVAYAAWLYLRVEMRVRRVAWLAVLRALALLTLLALLFDLRLPAGGGEGGQPWALLDASLSMGARSEDGTSAWEEASARALELSRQGWRVVPFGAAAGGSALAALDEEMEPSEPGSLLAPALERAAEAGAPRVRVLSDLRLEDQVAVRAALARLPLRVDFERFGRSVRNAGVSAFEVPDLVSPERSVTADVEIHASGADSVTVRVFEEERLVAEARVAAPSPGLRGRVAMPLPAPLASGRVRYTASVTLQGDGFRSDDVAVDYASVGYEEGAVVLVSFVPDWEPRYLLPVLEEVTGLPARGYLRVGADRFVAMGRALDRGPPLDSAAVGRAVADAALLVLHGFGAPRDAWERALIGRPGRKILLPRDGEGAAAAGIRSGDPRGGEWYASADLPTSPLAGALAGTTLQGLPPLSNVLLPADPAAVRGALLVQLRGAGAPEAALHLDDRQEGRVAVVLASGFWRWYARASGREPYRRIWSGAVGWLLADEAAGASELRPTTWVVARGEPVTWSVPAGSSEVRLVVELATSGQDAASGPVIDTLAQPGALLSTGALPPGTYRYRGIGGDGKVLAEGRFDVAAATAELAPEPAEFLADEGAGGAGGGREERPGTPIRTTPWPFLLVIGLLCSEWILRRRSGLR
jgi:hypothetical protein